MAEKLTRRRRRALLVPLLGLGVAAWAVRSQLAGRRRLDDRWEPLPPRPVPATPPGGATSPAAAPAAPEAVDGDPARQPEPVPTRARAVPAATAVASVAAPALPDAPFGPGSVRALDDGSSPDPAYTVKGKTTTRVFHAPASAYFTRTRADVWFRTEDDARAAGFTPRTARRTR